MIRGEGISAGQDPRRRWSNRRTKGKADLHVACNPGAAERQKKKIRRPQEWVLIDKGEEVVPVPR